MKAKPAKKKDPVRVRKSVKKKADYEIGFGKPPKDHQFKVGYDPRRNYHGRPSDLQQIRDLFRDVGQDEVELVNGQKVSRIYAKVLTMVFAFVENETKSQS